MPDGIDEIFTIRLLAHPVNAEVRSSFVGHHISATFELRAGVVKAEARRVERSESLDAGEHARNIGERRTPGGYDEEV